MVNNSQAAIQGHVNGHVRLFTIKIFKGYFSTSVTVSIGDDISGVAKRNRFVMFDERSTEFAEKFTNPGRMRKSLYVRPPAVAFAEKSFSTVKPSSQSNSASECERLLSPVVNFPQKMRLLLRDFLFFFLCGCLSRLSRLLSHHLAILVLNQQHLYTQLV